MQINKSLSDLFRNMGVVLTIDRTEGAGTAFRGFIQPLRYKNKIYLHGVATELGFDSLKKYLLISPVDVDLSEVDGINVTLHHGLNHLSVEHTETVYLGKKPWYNWSIVSKEE